MKTIQAICALLDIDNEHPKAKATALKRLEQLSIHGDKCPRCNGEGATFRGKQTGIQCYPCKGQGYVGFSLSRSALKQLKAAHTEGKLDDYHELWAIQADIKSKLKAFDDTMKASGIQKAYSAYWAEREQGGSWNRDMQAIHKQMELVRAQLFQSLDVEELLGHSVRTRRRLAEFFNKQYKIADQALDSLVCEMEMYQAWHSKPDYKSMCIALVRNGTQSLGLA
ncbi:MAG: hypothetical protein GY833_22470 [Aestuariibacter sp.]|nr:hypothetical protein [Aestuariibacter sp.]